MCGDSTWKDDVQKLFGGSVPNLMLTDPPYGVNLDNSWRDDTPLQRKGAGNKKTIKNDDRADWLETYQLFPGNVAYVWHATSQNHVVRQNLIDAGFETRQMIMWNKAVLVIGRSHYHWKHEPCWYAVRKGRDANWVGDRKQTTVWDAASPNHFMGKKDANDDKTEHPSQKPVVLYTIPIENHTKFGDGIYDPFLGSGTALIAAEKTGRKCFGMELDPAYCDIILARWENLTGQKAELLT
jgi:DNA modification methylase